MDPQAGCSGTTPAKKPRKEFLKGWKRFYLNVYILMMIIQVRYVVEKSGTFMWYIIGCCLQST